jgi:hypothetical protein
MSCQMPLGEKHRDGVLSQVPLRDYLPEAIGIVSTTSCWMRKEISGSG